MEKDSDSRKSDSFFQFDVVVRCFSIMVHLWQSDEPTPDFFFSLFCVDAQNINIRMKSANVLCILHSKYQTLSLDSLDSTA